MSRVGEWCGRMEKIVKRLGSGAEYIERHCPYKRKYFCDGRPNIAKENGNVVEKKPSCKHFKDGRCEQEMHLGRIKKEREKV